MWKIKLNSKSFNTISKISTITLSEKVNMSWKLANDFRFFFFHPKKEKFFEWYKQLCEVRPHGDNTEFNLF